MTKELVATADVDTKCTARVPEMQQACEPCGFCEDVRLNEDCSGAGTCENGACNCDAQWGGAVCDVDTSSCLSGVKDRVDNCCSTGVLNKFGQCCEQNGAVPHKHNMAVGCSFMSTER